MIEALREGLLRLLAAALPPNGERDLGQWSAAHYGSATHACNVCTQNNMPTSGHAPLLDSLMNVIAVPCEPSLAQRPT